MSGYEITEQDIQGILRYLQVFHPENANREFAEELLRYLKVTSRRLALTDPDALDDLYDAFRASRKSHEFRTFKPASELPAPAGCSVL